MDSEVQEPRRRGPAEALAQMPTGAKVFLILVGALLPLALIALFTTLQTSRDADREARARLQAAAEESSGVLATTLANHIPELREAVLALEQDAGDAASCTRVLGAYGSLNQAGVRVAILGRSGELLCGQRFTVGGGAAALGAGQVDPRLADNGLVLQVGGARGGTAMAYYPTPALATLARPSGFVPEYGATMLKGDSRLLLRALPGDGPLDRHETLRTEVGVGGLVLEMTMPGAPITGPLLITTVLLVLMWLAAAGIGWFVVDRLLIRPLRRLRKEVSAYKPGDVIDPSWSGAMPAQEIRELGNTFRDIARTVQTHEAGLAEGLVRQTRLTREVHHRVKNNLQVIASLINFHARGARSNEASEAYASIQRRVDALAVVHRHHYAELEEHRGLELRSVIGELASNLRATAPERAQGVGITLEIEPLLVNQDTAIAIAFLLTELIELAIGCAGAAQIRISVKAAQEPDRAVLRVSSPALVESARLEALLENRYARVIGGLARQLRTKLHHDPLVGAFEAGFAVTGRS
jgi:two-component system, sensor histidine kinase PdtaS